MSRRNLLAAGFGLIAFVTATLSSAVFRCVNRELCVARLQPEFVATVSHEFRTPLTAMRHLTEMRQVPDDSCPSLKQNGRSGRRPAWA